MDEEEYQRLVSGTVGGMGAAGALAHTENLSAWEKIQDVARSIQESDFMQGTGAWDTSDWGNAYEPGWEYKSDPEMIRDILADNHDLITKIITAGAGAAAGIPPWLTIPSALLESRDFIRGLLEDAGFNTELVESEGKGEVAGADIPTYVPYDPGEFEYGHWTEGLGEPNPEIGGRYGVYGDLELDYYNLGREAVEKGLYPEYSGPEFGGAPEYNVWANNAIPVIHAEEERKWKLEYDDAREAFDRRNEEEERRHREEYDKMVADMLAEQELEASMDTDFSTGDLGQGSGLSPTGELLKMLGDYFSQDAEYGPAESTPPSWLSVPSASIDPLNLDNALSWNNRVSPKVLNVEPSAQDIMDWNPGLFTPTNQFNTTIPNPALENMYNDPGAANKALDVLIPPLS